jgi:hypothetical protein
MMAWKTSIDARAVPCARPDKTARDNHGWIVGLRASQSPRYKQPFEK